MVYIANANSFASPPKSPESITCDYKLLSRADSLHALSHCIHKFSSLRLQALCLAVEMAKQRIALVQFRSTSKENGKNAHRNVFAAAKEERRA